MSDPNNKLVEALEELIEDAEHFGDVDVRRGPAYPRWVRFQDRLASARALLASHRASQQEGEYRNLVHKQDVIRPGDEHLNDDAKTWSPIQSLFFGMRYNVSVMQPSRRPTRKETQG